MINVKIACISMTVIIILFFITVILKKVIDNKFYCKDVFINGKKYKIQNRKGETEYFKSEVAGRLAALAEKADSLVIAAYERNYPTETIANRLASRWKNIRTTDSFREISMSESSAAYTVNKGDEMRICIRDRTDPTKLENENTSMFVLIHELAHLASESWGHGQEFKQRFAELVKLAVELNLYKYQDFEKNPEDYCGTEITNPAYRIGN